MKTNNLSVFAAAVLFSVANLATTKVAFAAAAAAVDNNEINIEENNNLRRRRGLNNNVFDNGGGSGNNGGGNGNGGGDKITVITVLNKDASTSSGGVTNKCNNLSNKNNGKTKNVIGTVLNACVLEVPAASIKSLENDADVDYVDIDMEIHALNTIWGLDRIDQCSAALDGDPFTQVDASGVKVYILDTGIRSTHSEFTGMIGSSSCHFDGTGEGGELNDMHYHGTHVAGTVVGKTYGVAECTGPTSNGGNGCELCSVKVLNSSGSGYLSWIIAGIDHVAADCGNQEGGPFTKKCVANMSLGATGVHSSFIDSVNRAVTDFGVVMAVAAGNDNDDACGYSPAAAEHAITVGSTNKPSVSNPDDVRSSFSNYGSCVNVWAPGASIESAHSSSDSATTLLSGTSMASPHVAGVAVGLLGSGMASSPAEVLQKMKQRSVFIDIDVSTNVELATTIGGCKGATISPAPTPSPVVLVPYTEHDTGSTVGEPSNSHSNKCVNNKGKRSGAAPYVITGLSGTVSVSTCFPGTNFDTVMHVYGPDGSCVAGSDDFCGRSSKVTFYAKQSEEYTVVLEGYGGDEGDYEVEITGNLEVPQTSSTTATQASTTAASSTTTTASTTAAASTTTVASTTAASSTTTTASTTASASTTTVASTTVAASSTTTTCEPNQQLIPGYPCPNTGQSALCCSGNCYTNGRWKDYCKSV